MRFSIKYIRNSSPRTLSSTLAFAHLDGSSSTARATSRTRAVWFLTTPLGAACTLGVTCWNDSSRRCCLTSGECSRRRSILWTSVIVPRLHGLQRLGGTSCGRLGWPCVAMSCEVWGPLRNREPSARKKHNSKNITLKLKRSYAVLQARRHVSQLPDAGRPQRQAPLGDRRKHMHPVVSYGTTSWLGSRGDWSFWETNFIFYSCGFHTGSFRWVGVPLFQRRCRGFVGVVGA